MTKKKFINSILNIRPGEWKITLLLFFNIYFLLLTYYLLKPARDALFLVEIGPSQLPFVFILIAVIMIPITSLYAIASKKYKLNKLIIYSLGILIVNLFLLRLLMTYEFSWTPYLFYAWVSIFGALTTSQFWLLANAAYNATEAKRLFTIIGLGGILGAWSGGEITSLVISLFDLQTENLLIISALILVINIVLTSTAWSVKKHEILTVPKSYKRKPGKSGSFKQLLLTIKSSKHLLYIISIVGIAMIITSLVDFQFKAISTISFQDSVTGVVDKTGLTSFLGTFYGRLSLVSILIQLFVSGRMLRVMGVGGIILFLPIGLLLGTAGLIGFIGLTSVVILRGADGALKNSIDKTGRELLFLPIPGDLKNQTKVFIDTFIDRGARGLAGVLLILLIFLFDYDSDPYQAVRAIGFVVLFFLLIWLTLGVLIRKEYVNTFRIAIKNREIDQSDLRFRFDDPSTIRTLLNSLNSGNKKEINYALDMLSSATSEEIIDPIKELLWSRSVSIRRKAVKILINQKNRSLTQEFEMLLRDTDIDIRSDAIYYLSSQGNIKQEREINKYINHSDPILRITVFLTIAKYGGDNHKALIKPEHFEKLLEEKFDDPLYIQTQIIRIIGRLNDDKLIAFLKRFTDCEDDELTKQTIKAIGRLQAEEYIPWLIGILKDTRFRSTAVKSLAKFGENILPILTGYLLDSKSDITVSKFIPKVISEIPSQNSINLLMESMNRVDSYLKFSVIKALNRAKANYPNLSFDCKTIDDIIIREIKSYYEIFQTLNIIGEGKTDGLLLLIKALQEYLDNNLERIFRIMGLRYPSHDIYSAYSKITGNNDSLRASAIEFLDNLLKGNVKKLLFPILDASSVDEVILTGMNYLEISKLTRTEVFQFLMRSNDSWIKSLAIFNIEPDKNSELIDEIRQLAEDNDQLVRETAVYKLKQIV